MAYRRRRGWPSSFGGVLALDPDRRRRSALRVARRGLGVFGIVVAFVALAGDNGIDVGDRGIGFWCSSPGSP